MPAPPAPESNPGQPGACTPVDIVITNHNYGAYVCEAVESALNQDHPAVRVIVIDDGSTDDSRRRLARFEDRAELVMQENHGQPAAVNAGFARCQGEVVIFLDADDTLAPSVAGRVAETLAAEPSAARVQFQAALVDASGRPRDRAGGFHPRPIPRGDLRVAELAAPFDLAWAPMSANAFRSAALRRIMPIPEADYGRWGADYYLVHLTALLGTVAALEEVGAFYRVHGENAFQRSEPHLDLDRIRREIGYQQATLKSLSALADELGMQRPDPILSLSNVSLRVISYRLARSLHPIEDERRSRLLLAAIRAAARRKDLSAWARLALVAAIGAVASAPMSSARRLAEMLVFPELRPRLGIRG